VAIATIIELVASFVFPVIVTAAGRSDWVLPSIAVTIRPLLLWLDHLVHIPRCRPVGWALTIGPVILVATMSGSALAVTTGLTAGFLQPQPLSPRFRYRGEQSREQCPVWPVQVRAAWLPSFQDGELVAQEQDFLRSSTIPYARTAAARWRSA
jgi:hypothetical protein